MKTVFLCGPIRGLDKSDYLGWRKEAEKKLGDDFNVIHALRHCEEKGSFPFPKAKVARDKHDILNSDIILVNDTFENASMIGTSMEVIFANERDKIVVIFGEAHKNDFWLETHSHIRFYNLDEAIDFVRKMLK